MQVLVPVVHSLVVLDNEGDRLLAKYYDGRSKTEQVAYEALINKKTKNVPAKVDGGNYYVCFLCVLKCYLLLSSGSNFAGS